MSTNKMITGVMAAGTLLTLAGAALAISPMDKQFATKAAQGGIFEVKSSQIAVAKTHNVRVMNVARRMIKEHTAANNELKTVAQNKAMSLPAETDPKHKAIIAHLSSLSGSAFDKAYMASQETAHADTIKLFEKEIATGKDAGYTAFASKNLPTIEDHTKMIFQVGSTLGVHATTMPTLKPAMMPSDMSGKNM